MPDFSRVTYPEALERARALVPALRERAVAAEAARALPADTVRDLRETGLAHALRPKRWGGMELEFRAYVDIPLELARGCPSTSWNVVNLTIHDFMLALYDERAQRDVWGENPAALIAAAIAYPQGQARRVDGGFVLSGRWNFCSGVDVADWNMLAAVVRDGEQIVDHRLCLVPRSAYEVIDDWQVMGMAATASMTVVAKDVFVPDYRALCAYDMRGGDGFPGAAVNPGALYRIPMPAIGAHGIGGTAIGNAEAALACITSMGSDSIERGDSHFQSSLTLLSVSGAGARIETARHVLLADCEEAQAMAVRNAIPDITTKLKWKRNLAYASQLCTEAVDMLHAVAGENGIYRQYPLERILRDAHAIGGHIMHNFDTHGSAWGYAALGGENRNPTL